jgi:hypothetical protein
MHVDLLKLLDAAEALGDGSILALMAADAGKLANANTNARIAQDVPVASEMFGLLRHSLEVLSLRPRGECDVTLEPGIVFDSSGEHVVALMPVKAGELDLIAYWLSQGIQSPKLLALPGVLALPFAIETFDDRRWLIPEWFALFYVDALPAHCVPLLAMRSVLNDERFGDWVSNALARADAFGLPVSDAVAGAEKVILQKASHT